ncbi:MAG: glycerate kinase [Bradymonadales bacterium]|nr:glycerate kinase [Bradymonadales bacterium]
MAIRLLIAPDSFKQCRSSDAVAGLLAEGARRAAQGRGLDLSIRTIPMSDGGEGFLDAIRQAIGGEVRTASCTAVDRGGQAAFVDARWLWHESSATAFGESAEVVGLRHTRCDTPRQRTARGVGEYLLAMRSCSPRRLVLGVGGTATVEGGASVAAGLNVRFRSGRGSISVHQPTDALEATRIELPPPWTEVEVECWCDVSTPLVGPTGAVALFAPQKGAAPAEVTQLQQEVQAWADRMASRSGVDPTCPGSGAGGGIPFGVMLATRTRIRPGGPAVAELVGLERAIQEADLVWTGEGRVDRTTAEGKLVGTVLKLARPLARPITIFTGQVQGDLGSLLEGCTVVPLAEPQESPHISMAQVEPRLIQQARSALESWLDESGQPV